MSTAPVHSSVRLTVLSARPNSLFNLTLLPDAPVPRLLNVRGDGGYVTFLVEITSLASFDLHLDLTSMHCQFRNMYGDILTSKGIINNYY